MTYKPRPIDTSAIELDQGLADLVEHLAASNHDVWAVGRIGEGWVYGAGRDDAARTHPDLVPYDDLADSEKEYDRKSVVETLKAIIALGYRIEKA